MRQHPRFCFSYFAAFSACFLARSACICGRKLSTLYIKLKIIITPKNDHREKIVKENDGTVCRCRLHLCHAVISGKTCDQADDNPEVTVFKQQAQGFLQAKLIGRAVFSFLLSYTG
jgi:hypothetical protein